ncbi:DEAD/DEAH box helicase [uncultured Megasphaera sp.]|uniref:DEAD/DEAH box helicase n=1 Tax=uncultured Megasphaera sp. TaxID=165188 RepID=UPI0025F3BD5E|nr:DEAD/DEAH box helicase [uncultured Megasphaera sp.]
MLEKFQNLNISEVIIRALNEMGFEEPTPIQAESIPVAMSGSDMIGQAQTGTGKTAAYGIPVLEKILKAEPSKDIQTVVLSPTRELAMQVAEELNHLAQFTHIQALPIYGGQDMGRQLRRLRKCPQIVVATPGRLIDHMKRGTIDLSHITTIVLDEADEMLDMGFIDDINLIMAATPNTRQTLLFSATMPKPIQQLAETFLHDPLIIRMKAKEVTMDLIEQSYIEVPDRQKFDILCRLLDLQEPDLAIIFVRTKRRVDEVSEALKKRGYSAEGIHGDLTQAKRDTVIRQFREKTIDILVATDVAARGLDISGVTHVFNYDLPQDPESYVHRVGRTGRAGQSGEATTFVIPREMEHLRTIERLIKRRITRRKAPTFSEALEGAQQAAIRSLITTTEEGNFGTYKENAEELLSNYDSASLVAAAIKLLTKEPDTTPVKITEEAPLRVRRSRSNNNRDRRNNYRNRNDRHRKDDDPSKDEQRGERRRHFAPKNRDNKNRSNNHGNYRNNRRDNNKQHKEPNRSVFKPYFKD